MSAHAPTSVPIAELTRRIADRPGSPALHLERGDLRRVVGDFAGARADYDAVERLDREHPGLRLARARLALDTGEPATARELLSAELAARPADAHALRLRARAWVTLGERRAAIEQERRDAAQHADDEDDPDDQDDQDDQDEWDNPLR